MPFSFRRKQPPPPQKSPLMRSNIILLNSNNHLNNHTNHPHRLQNTSSGNNLSMLQNVSNVSKSTQHFSQQIQRRRPLPPPLSRNDNDDDDYYYHRHNGIENNGIHNGIHNGNDDEDSKPMAYVVQQQVSSSTKSLLPTPSVTSTSNLNLNSNSNSTSTSSTESSLTSSISSISSTSSTSSSSSSSFSVDFSIVRQNLRKLTHLQQNNRFPLIGENDKTTDNNNTNTNTNDTKMEQFGGGGSGGDDHHHHQHPHSQLHSHQLHPHQQENIKPHPHPQQPPPPPSDHMALMAAANRAKNLHHPNANANTNNHNNNNQNNNNNSALYATLQLPNDLVAQLLKLLGASTQPRLQLANKTIYSMVPISFEYTPTPGRICFSATVKDHYMGVITSTKKVLAQDPLPPPVLDSELQRYRMYLVSYFKLGHSKNWIRGEIIHVDKFNYWIYYSDIGRIQSIARHTIDDNNVAVAGGSGGGGGGGGGGSGGNEHFRQLPPELDATVNQNMLPSAVRMQTAAKYRPTLGESMLNGEEVNLVVKGWCKQTCTYLVDLFKQ